MAATVLVLAHGINDTCRKFKTMQAVFEGNGYRCIVPSLTPKNGSQGLPHLATQLKSIIDAEMADNNAAIALIGFSMGGLVSRYYLQELEGHKRVGCFFSISAPHHGSLLAYLSTALGARQMRPGSDFLRRLQQTDGRLDGLDCYSYWTPFDLMILPTASSVWVKAENIKVKALCHPSMVKDKRLIADILVKLSLLSANGR